MSALCHKQTKMHVANRFQRLDVASLCVRTSFTKIESSKYSEVVLYPAAPGRHASLDLVHPLKVAP